MTTTQAPLDSGFGFHSTADEVLREVNLSGKHVLITGGHSGIGLETTRALAARGASVIVGARDVTKAAAALASIPKVRILALDLSHPRSIDGFAAQALALRPELDLLINNAGVMATPETRDERGFEIQFVTNHLGHFQLTARLANALKPGGRVVTLSSAGHRFSPVHLDDLAYTKTPYDKWQAYGRSKTANSLFAVELDRRLRARGIRSLAVHPGRIIATALARHMDPQEVASASQASPALMKNVPQGAATTAWAATSPKLAAIGGVYCADCDVSPLVEDLAHNPAGVLRYAIDTDAARELWERLEAILRLAGPV